MGMGTLILWGLMGVAAGPADVGLLKTRDLTIPITVNEERRAQILELQLWFSEDQGRSWTAGPRAHPGQDAFSFKADHDGDYWFTMQVTNTARQKEPADLRGVPHDRILKVCVDTRPPAITVQPPERVTEGVRVSWRVEDGRSETLRVEYRAADAGEEAWVAAPVSNPTLIGQTLIASAPAGPLKVRVTASDAAGNTQGAVADVAGVNAPPAPPATPVAKNGELPARPAAGPPNLLTADPGIQRTSSQTDAPPPVGSFVAPKDGSSAVSTNLMQANEPPASPPATGAAAGLPPAQIINFTQISLDYNVVKQGPSGLKSVELWITRDDGRTWERYADDPDHVSPLIAKLPGDGVYGLKLVSTSGAGFSQGPPAPGEVPESRVEVDTQRPSVSLTAVEPNADRADVLTLRWVASDKNLTASPITLEWAAQAEGPWSSVAPGTLELPNTGSYQWELPLQMPYRVYLRIAARDRAGNVGEYRTGSSVLVDTKKPQIAITRISPVGPAAPPTPPPAPYAPR